MVFLGSWCGDTKRELPRFLKIMEFLKFPETKIKLIGVDRTKKAPVYTENIWNIEFVPTFIFLKNGMEIGRIVEQPVASLEQDMKQILGMKYSKTKGSKLLNSSKKADIPPIFGNCDQYVQTVDKLNCSDAQLHEYFRNNMITRYGEMPIVGTALVSFVIDTDGSVKDVDVIKAGSTFAVVEAERLFNLMNRGDIRWKPAKKDEKTIAVRHQCLIRFDHQ
jgi:thiol-disulfide isomerase/thioredoxin